MSGFHLIASYPKSGNTWVRIALEAMLHPESEPDINALSIAMMANQTWLEERLGLDPLELTPSELAAVRPQVFSDAAAELRQPAFLKVHDAFLPDHGAAAAPYAREAIAGVIYLVRDPRDVAVSYACHRGKMLAQAVDDICNPGFRLSWPDSNRARQIGQLASSWSRHVESWVYRAALPLLVQRYEDMLADPGAAFTAIARFAGLMVDERGIQRAVAATAFDKLRAAEAQHGFKERHRDATAPFFRSGKAGGWKDELPSELAARLVQAHGPVMRDFGYLP